MNISSKIITINFVFLALLTLSNVNAMAHCDSLCTSTVCHKMINGIPNSHCNPMIPQCIDPCNLDTLNPSDSIVTCGPGEYLYTKIITIGTCQYKVEMCHKCMMSYPGYVYLKRISALPGQSCTGITAGDLISQAMQALINSPQFIWTQLCQSNGPGPGINCANPLTVEWVYAKCWQRKVFSPENYEVYTSCEGSSFCTQTISYCWDNQTNQVIKTIIKNMGTPGEDCDKEWFEEGQPNECFIHPIYPCNP